MQSKEMSWKEVRKQSKYRQNCIVKNAQNLKIFDVEKEAEEASFCKDTKVKRWKKPREHFKE